MSLEQRQLEAGIDALEKQRDLLGDAVVDAAVAGLRAKLAALQGLPSAQALRQVSILFLDVVGSTSLSQHLDPEEISVVMDGLLSRGTAIVEAHRGKVLKYAGDNLLAAFGADEVAEDDAERAVRCGLALLELGVAAGAEVHARHGHPGFGVRVGIHTGGALLGGGVDEDSSIRGQAVNIAARMEQTAPAGSLRISQDTYRLVHGAFDVDPQEPLLVKGVDAPIRTYLVRRAKPRAFKAAARGIEGVETRMIGRDRELGVLKQAFDKLMQPGASHARVLVVADAGVGKSRLLYEFQKWAEADARRFCVFQARATPQSQRQAYGMLRDLFAWHWKIQDSDTMEVAKRKLEDGLMLLFQDDDGASDAEANAHLLGHLIGLDYGDSRHVAGIQDDAQQVHDRGFNAAAQALRRIGARDGLPIVMYLDDLHWADDGSLDFLDYLAHVDSDVPLLQLALTRPTLFERRGGRTRGENDVPERRIDLDRLDQAGSRMLADELLKQLPEIPASLRDLIIGRADGNPFYMEELVKMLVDRGAITISPERWTLDPDKLRTLEVPLTLTGVLQARLDGLPPQERRALQLASVIGLVFWDAALCHVESRAAAQLPSLQARALVEPKEVAVAPTEDVREYAFHHQLLHSVTYDTVLKSTRQQAHARTADWLAHHAGALRKSLLGAAAEHYELAGDAEQAAEFYARAAQQMAGTFAHGAALEYATRGLALARDDDVELRWRLLAQREALLSLLGRRDAIVADLEALDALAEAMPPGALGDSRRAEVARRRSDLAHRSGDWVGQEREARHSLALAERSGNESLALSATKRLAEALAYRGDAAVGRALAEAALARMRALGLEVHESGLLVALTVCTDALGDRVAGLTQSLQDLALNRRRGNRVNEAVALSNVGMSYLTFGAFPEADRHLQEALRLHRGLGNRHIEGNTYSVLSELAWREGDAALALRRGQAAYDIAVETGSRLYETDALWSLGNAELALGRLADADRAFERSYALAHEIASAAQMLNALDGRARVALAIADTAQALHFAERLMSEARASASQQAASTPSNLFAGAYEHLIRLTLYRVWSSTGDARADSLLAEAYDFLMADADRVHDTALRHLFLTRMQEHREIVELWRCRGTSA